MTLTSKQKEAIRQSFGMMNLLVEAVREGRLKHFQADSPPAFVLGVPTGDEVPAREGTQPSVTSQDDAGAESLAESKSRFERWWQDQHADGGGVVDTGPRDVPAVQGSPAPVRDGGGGIDPYQPIILGNDCYGVPCDSIDWTTDDLGGDFNDPEDPAYNQ